MIILDKNQPYYKGTTHIHTTCSDGMFTPDEVISMYKKRGYAFLAISDHGKFIRGIDALNEDLVILCGCEFTCKILGKKYAIHINVIYKDEETRYKYFAENDKISFNFDSYKEFNDFLLSFEDAILTLNHPLTTYVNYDDLLKLTALTSIEVYNHGSYIRANNGIAFNHYTYALANGHNLLTIAADDFHAKEHVQAIEPPMELLDRHIGGFVSLQADSMTRDAIFTSLRSGRYYSSMGPEITHLEIIEDRLLLECSPVRTIRVYANKDLLKIEKGENITSSSVELSLMNYIYERAKRDNVLGKTTNYLILEIEDEDRKLAWTNNLIPILEKNYRLY